MKKDILKYLIAALLMLALFNSCKEDDDPEYYDSAKLDLSANTFTFLDAQLYVEIDFLTTIKTVSSVTIYKHADNSELSTGTATNNLYTFTLQRSIFGPGGDTTGASQRIDVHATVDGKVKEMYSTIGIASAVSIKDPFYEDVDDDGNDIEVDDYIYELSSVVKNFTYDVEPAHTSTAVTVQAFSKIGVNATYASKWAAMAYDADDLDIGFVGTDYTKGDTVYVMLLATSNSGAFRDSVESKTIVKGYELGDLELELMMDTSYVNQNLGYDLLGDSLVADTDPVSMIEFSTSGYNVGFTLSNNTVVTDLTTEGTNLPLLKATVDAGSVTSIADVSVGDEFIVKHTRDTKDYYGILEIVELGREGDDAYIKLKFALEEYDVEN